MEHWNGGYVSDTEYEVTFFQEQSPVYLNFVAAFHGFEPVPLDRPFTYFELGFGQGLTLNMLAAANPQGRFYGNDFNASMVVGAQEMAGAAQLDNVVLLENSFAELADGQVDLPKFDFVTMHGVWMWVSAEQRSHIVRFLRRYLKPGGIVFVSYNALPGWSRAMPLQRLLLEFARTHPNPTPLQLEQARALIAQLSNLNAAYLSSNPGLERRLKMLLEANPQYVIHEYMHSLWEPQYHADVARDLAMAKLDYVGAVSGHNMLPQFSLTPEQHDLVSATVEPIMRETLTDYMLNTQFREDLFVRGARPMAEHKKKDWMERTGIALTRVRKDASFNLRINGRTVNRSGELYIPLFDALASGPQTFEELATLRAFKDQPASTLIEIAALLIETKQALPWSLDSLASDPSPSHRINKVIAEHSQFSNKYDVLASPLLGSALECGRIHRLVYLALSQGMSEFDAGAISDYAWKTMKVERHVFANEDGTWKTDEERKAELNDMVALILQHRLPVWRDLKMIENCAE